MVLTNFNAIKGANGRRYCVLDINPNRMNDFEYFGSIRDNCYNDECGYAFFCYLYDYDINNFNSLDIPVTQSKKDSCADLLSPLEKFLKFEFLLKKKIVNVKVKDLLELFKNFCTTHNLLQNNKLSIQKLNGMMRDLSFDNQKSDGYYKYVISIERLEKVAQNKKWLHDLDEDSEYNVTDDIIDYKINDSEKEFVSTQKYLKLHKEMKELKNQLQMLQSKLDQVKEVQLEEVEHKSYSDDEYEDYEEDVNLMLSDDENEDPMQSDDEEEIIKPKPKSKPKPKVKVITKKPTNVHMTGVLSSQALFNLMEGMEIFN
jgi:hypothetical protein